MQTRSGLNDKLFRGIQRERLRRAQQSVHQSFDFNYRNKEQLNRNLRKNMLNSIKKSKLLKQIERTRKEHDQRDHLKMQQQLGLISEVEFREQIKKLECKEEADSRISLGTLLKHKYLNNEGQKYASIDFNLDHLPYQNDFKQPSFPKGRDRANIRSSLDSDVYGSVAASSVKRSQHSQSQLFNKAQPKGIQLQNLIIK